jgi:hypothetical protein
MVIPFRQTGKNQAFRKTLLFLTALLALPVICAGTVAAAELIAPGLKLFEAAATGAVAANPTIIDGGAEVVANSGANIAELAIECLLLGFALILGAFLAGRALMVKLEDSLDTPSDTLDVLAQAARTEPALLFASDETGDPSRPHGKREAA